MDSPNAKEASEAHEVSRESWVSRESCRRVLLGRLVTLAGMTDGPDVYFSIESEIAHTALALAALMGIT